MRYLKTRNGWFIPPRGAAGLADFFCSMLLHNKLCEKEINHRERVKT